MDRATPPSPIRRIGSRCINLALRPAVPDRHFLTSYVLRLPCGCDVHVISPPQRPASARRLIRRRAEGCPTRTHKPGARVYLWELLPPRAASEHEPTLDIDRSAELFYLDVPRSTRSRHVRPLR